MKVFIARSYKIYEAMIKRVLLTGILISILYATILPQSVRQLTRTGETFMEAGQYEAAYEQFTQIIQAAPNRADGYMARAGALEAMERYEDAYSDLERAHALAERDEDVLIALGRIGNILGRYEDALKHLNRASALARRNYDIYPEKVITLIRLRRLDQALAVADTALTLSRRDTRSHAHYLKGKVYTNLNNETLAKREFEQSVRRDGDNPDPRLALAELLIAEGDLDGAMSQCNEVLKRNDNDTRAHTLRSLVYLRKMDFPSAINDISRNIVIEPDNPDHLLTRGRYYQQFNQHSNAIADFSNYIAKVDDNVEVYIARARSYEAIQDYNRAINDYNRVTEMARFNEEAHLALEDVKARLFELNRESDPPSIEILVPEPAGDAISVRGDAERVVLSAVISDQSYLKYVTVNDERFDFTEDVNRYELSRTIYLEDLTAITIEAADVYDNVKRVSYDIVRTETDPPLIFIQSPRASDGGIIFLPNNDAVQRIEGRIQDESLIRSITIDGVSATYFQTDLNPTFSARVDVANKRSITVEAEDIHGNRAVSEFTLSREGATLTEANPMGLTWAIFIENSNYTRFATLEGPTNDVQMMQRALENYEFHRIIHKRDMTRAEMERFFSVELRDLVRNNNVNSLLVWYAGHGVFVNNVSYWIPVDASRDDELTYFNIDALPGLMRSYAGILEHLLVVTDACESGPGFYTAMRDVTIPDCADFSGVATRSAQVVSSAGVELAADNSQFTQTFYNVLMNNVQRATPQACIPINSIVETVTEAVRNVGLQEPQFGLIRGLDNEGGTFFFIKR